ncbi:hypothetical protein A33Q_1331 [Indibacter alkaliphilus LW1]|uniref:Uncharacterized protein n=1 Tax=Indibacter alkaliphilus (strain CCUG 57479 / KCTC 22604 / LW1) TaxID=1189612 RepID=S2DI48_INDAL|nr:hypothetical protein A33Q_1331 [Indibacter alkaliphilus LW1]
MNRILDVIYDQDHSFVYKWKPIFLFSVQFSVHFRKICPKM